VERETAQGNTIKVSTRASRHHTQTRLWRSCHDQSSDALVHNIASFHLFLIIHTCWSFSASMCICDVLLYSICNIFIFPTNFWGVHHVLGCNESWYNLSKENHRICLFFLYKPNINVWCATSFCALLPMVLANDELFPDISWVKQEYDSITKILTLPSLFTILQRSHVVSC
jgi:hypothetical protein